MIKMDIAHEAPSTGFWYRQENRQNREDQNNRYGCPGLPTLTQWEDDVVGGLPGGRTKLPLSHESLSAQRELRPPGCGGSLSAQRELRPTGFGVGPVS